VQVAVGEDDEAAVLGPGVFTSLFFADEWIFVLGFGFEDKQREALGIEQEKIDEACQCSSRSCCRGRPDRWT
jgi:hypothetical protein